MQEAHHKADAKKARVTLQLVKSLTARPQWPQSCNRIVWDDDVTGFGVRVTAAGAISFVLRYVFQGQEHRITVGKYPDLTPSAAREMAISMRGTIIEGKDPLAARIQNREAPTVDMLCDDYLARHAESKKRASSVYNDKRKIEGIIRPKLGTKKVALVSRRDIDEIHQSMKDTPYHANRLLSLVSKMFSLAVLWGWRSDNPAKGIERFQEHKRDRWLNTDELAALSAALENHKDKRVANAIRLLLLTGARRSEVLKATWDQFDFERNVWTKPSHHTKQKKTEHVPLSAPTLSLLSDMQSKAEDDGNLTPFLFPGDKDNQPLRHIKRGWLTICRAAELAIQVEKKDKTGKVVKDKKGNVVMVWKATARIHDLRHTYASHLVSSGLSLPLVGRLIGHTQASTTQRYAHLADDPLRQATDRFGELITALPRKPASNSNVVTLKKAGGRG
jgi:integrase